MDEQERNMHKIIDKVVEKTAAETQAIQQAAPAALPKLEEEASKVNAEVPSDLREVWYDRRNFLRYAKTLGSVEGTPQGYVYHYLYTFASCVLEGQLFRISEEVYERNKKYAEQSQALALVIDPNKEGCRVQENDLILEMQRRFDSDPNCLGQVIVGLPGSLGSSAFREKI